MPEAEPHQIPTIVWLLKSGGLAPLALGLLLTVVGIVFVIRPSRTASIILAFLSLLPAIFGLVVVFSAAADYSEMAVSPTSPKPAELAEITGRAMGSSIGGLLGTIVPAFVAILGLLRTYKNANAVNVETETSALSSLRKGVRNQ